MIGALANGAVDLLAIALLAAMGGALGGAAVGWLVGHLAWNRSAPARAWLERRVLERLDPLYAGDEALASPAPPRPFDWARDGDL